MAGLVLKEGSMDCKHKNITEKDEWKKCGSKFVFHYFVTFSLCKKCGRKVLIGGTLMLMNVFDQSRSLEFDVLPEDLKRFLDETIPKCKETGNESALAEAYREIIGICEYSGGCFLEAALVYEKKLQNLSL
ncbi:MAG: hypothetical protein KAQ64_05155 [Candidatus Pacebacteria bacterium]|nr:hypothetical protein [Candidatus Paceibacterota bacterium]